ncbi:acetyl-CoA acetyltransferase [Mycolicibacterium setense]|uniref:thiolase family protein n=1 Tax=Mycolicibacterium setense TaxID=431269 RepID=UPI0007E9D645|nr:acetyl-CoA C-acyltransferase [Mycolicibacterium setense]OBB14662.1 acetyl-CoA acetyltransferase [Mycolicibacterium setense]
MPEAVIVSAVRSPIGRAVKGSLADVRPDDLVADVIRECVVRAGIRPDILTEHTLGTAYPERTQGGNLARRASLLAGLPVELPGATVTRFCASSLEALRIGTHAIWAGEATAFLVSGVESISQVGRTTQPEDLHPAFTTGDLPDVYISMGETAENVAERYNVARSEMDDFALASHRKAVAAQDSGLLSSSIVPIERPDGAVITVDDGPRRDTNLERLANLPPVFREGGSVTAGNSCPLSDGAAAAVLTSDVCAMRQGLTPRARIVSTAVTGVAPEIMGVGPIHAIRWALSRARLSIDDIDVVEFNEAFASQVLAVSREVGIDVDTQLNPAGGAIALGHPFGMTGVRLLCTLLDNLDAANGRYGLATLCVGGGQGMAVVVERL